MKILLAVSTKFEPNSGVVGVVFNLGQQYQALGHQVSYYCLDNLPNWLPGIVKLILFPWFLLFYVLKPSDEHKYDVVDAAGGEAWVLTEFRKIFKANHPLVVMRSHGLENTYHIQLKKEAETGNLQFTWKYWFYRGSFRLWEELTVLRNADLVLLLNNRDRNYAVKRLGKNSERLHIIANGIPETLINLPFQSTPESVNSTIRIALLASYIPRKGIAYSVPALKTIIARYPQVKVSFLGTGCSKEYIYKDFELSMRDRIHIVPRYPCETLPTLLKEHQILLFPSLFEGFSLALLEAMACGLTPVATNIPGNRELLSDECDSILIPPHDSTAIEQALERLITDRIYLEQLRRHAYATAQKYSWKQIAQNTISLYKDVLNRKILGTKFKENCPVKL